MSKKLTGLMAALMLAMAVSLPLMPAPAKADAEQPSAVVMSSGEESGEEPPSEFTKDDEEAESDPEYKYVPVRRFSTAASETNYFDGKLISAADLNGE